MVFDIVDNRGRAFVSLKPSHVKKLLTIEQATGRSEEEIFRDALNFYYSDLIKSGIISFNIARKNEDINSIEDAEFVRIVSFIENLMLDGSSKLTP